MNKTLQSLLKIFGNPNTYLYLYVVAALAITIRQFVLGTTPDGYTYYNNYILFKNAFWHLIQYKDLYVFHTHVQQDLYKYSPTFAVLMAPLAILPNFLGLFLWNVLNVIFIWWGVKGLRLAGKHANGFALLFILQELITSLLNSQSNGLIAGLMITGYVLAEKNRNQWGILCWAIAVFIKPFAGVMFVYWLFSRQKLAFIMWSIVWVIALTGLPLLFISIEQYGFLLNSWQNMLSQDHSGSMGYSVMGLLNNFFDVSSYKLMVVGIGLIILLLPLLRATEYKNELFRHLMLASLLIWVVIFNHKAESPTFVIAVSGVAIWYWAAYKHMNYLNMALLALVFLLTQLSPTDVFPAHIRNEVIQAYSLKALPCVLVWIKLNYDLLFSKSNDLGLNSQVAD